MPEAGIITCYCEGLTIISTRLRLTPALPARDGTRTPAAGFHTQWKRNFYAGEPLAKLIKTALCVAVAGALAGAVTSMGQPPPDSGSRKDAESSQQSLTEGSAPRAAAPKSTLPPDLSARKRVGKASFYAKQFFGKPMADGEPMDPQGDNAASRTLPLGTTAKVTNVETGKAAVITIEDRGPYVDGRLVDLSPGTAAKIGLTPRKGVTKVVVAPIAVPLPSGKVTTGAAAHEPLEKPDELPLHEGKSAESAESDKLAQGKSAKKSTKLASVEDVATHDK